MTKRIYLDYAASTPVDARVLRAMEPYFSVQFGNPGSLHAFGQEAIAAVDRSREIIAQALGADFREILFTGSATEANNLALRGVLGALRRHSFGTGGSPAPAAGDRLRSRSAAPRWQAGDQARRNSESFLKNAAETVPPRLIVSAIEHESILETARDLERQGVEVVVIPVDRLGRIDMKKLVRALDERTALVSVMYANNEIGTIQPIAELSAAIRRFRERQNKGAWPLFHTDAVQAFQLLSCKPEELGVDLMTLSAHKLYGPKGIGVLYVRKKTPLSAVVTGGGQEFGLRSGTENIPAIVGFAEAVRLADRSRQKERERLYALMRDAWSGIRRQVRGATVNGVQIAAREERLPNIMSIHVPGMNAEELLTRLDLAHIAASSGSACSARAHEPSHVLRAIGCSVRRANESIRLSFGRQTTKRDIDTVVSVLKQLFRTQR
ncbi:MAG: hypothetical protein RL681_606 [Candidatus Parcubacteria bacterium]|jgi:cysteine desulfurase